MKKLLLIGLFGLCSAANAAVFEVEMTGPGGHSNGNYGNVNAVHAGARAILALEKALPCASAYNFKGGATVNAIAGDTRFLVNTGVCKEDAAALQEKITAAVKQGADEENAFRPVKAGDLVKGFPAEIRFSVKQVGK